MPALPDGPTAPVPAVPSGLVLALPPLLVAGVLLAAAALLPAAALAPAETLDMLADVPAAVDCAAAEPPVAPFPASDPHPAVASTTAKQTERPAKAYLILSSAPCRDCVGQSCECSAHTGLLRQARRLRFCRAPPSPAEARGNRLNDYAQLRMPSRAQKLDVQRDRSAQR